MREVRELIAMCGRFSLSSSTEKISDFFNLALSLQLHPQYNIFPGQDILIVREKEDAPREFALAHWGFVPPWLKEEEIGSKWINARIETIDIRPLFKNSFKHKRCLIVADGFFEWTQTKAKQPYFFHLKKNEPFGFAGIWTQWKNEKGKIIESCAILTTAANSVIKPVHPRMPIILTSHYFDSWLSSAEINKEKFTNLMNKELTTLLIGYPVSTYVNNPSHQSKKCISHLATENK